MTVKRSSNISLSITAFCLFTFGIHLEDEKDYICNNIDGYTHDYREVIYKNLVNYRFRTRDFGNKRFDMFLDHESKHIYYIIYKIEKESQ